MAAHNRTTLRCLSSLGTRTGFVRSPRSSPAQILPPRVQPLARLRSGFLRFEIPRKLAVLPGLVVYFYGAYARQETLATARPAEGQGGSRVRRRRRECWQHSLFLSRYCKEVTRSNRIRRCAINWRARSREPNHNIVVHDVGIGERAGELDFYGPAGANAGTGSFVPSHAVDIIGGSDGLRSSMETSISHGSGCRRSTS